MAKDTVKNPEDRLNTPANIVTIIRVCLIPVFVVALLSPWPALFGLGDAFSNHEKAIVATVIFVVISLTDFLDGYLARSRNEITTFGKFMDPLADKMLVIAALLVLVELDILPSWPVIIIIAREFIVSGIRMLAANQGVVIAASWYGKFKTTFQIIAIVLFLLKEGVSSTEVTGVLADPLYIIAWVVMLIALVLTIISMVDYINGFIKMLNSNKTEDQKMELDLKEQLKLESQNLLELLKDKDLKIITAESLTGGLISAYLTSIPGSSEVVVGGVASYAYELKRDALKVDYDNLLKNGAVNGETATQMVKGALDLSIANVAVAVTGIAGPGGEEPGKPVGTVFMGIMSDKMEVPDIFELHFTGNRDEIRLQTVQAALEILPKVIETY
ncbi:MAG: CDP-diacylglycerol--glycerol-3-phosphate 3-phosphatidyltransferase [Phoenicibacter congonensis]|uniref:CDP-diacylglycerol--glycerol-3-phosphate 3-phosphatidyltransferase n=1 Tax=Phoenicibacter congonensis TaxID=1944646 RepID=A0AA43U8J6_9ACTN|nr:CDP-diacylglycerol--glycerol-3-phosphate 3-phosphatidyltransferase [Phoenicibacter congonensis]